MEDFREKVEAISSVLEKDMFFICGNPKSGTTWLQLLLDAHPEIACRGEGYFMPFLSGSLGNLINAYNDKIILKSKVVFSEIGGFPTFDQEDFMHLFRSCVALLMAKYDSPDVRLIGEKTPENIVNLPVLAMLFPAARFIHIIRDGRDVAVSAWHHRSRGSSESTNGGGQPFAAFVAKSAEIWKQSISSGKVFESNHPDRYLEVRYEDLHADGPTALGRVFEFLDADDTVAKDCLKAAAFETVNNGRGRGQEDPSSFFRKGVVGDWQNHFDDEAKAAFEETAGEALKMLGYA